MVQEQKKKAEKKVGLNAEVEVKQGKVQVPEVDATIDGIDNVLAKAKVKSRMIQLRGSSGDEPLLEWEADDVESIKAAKVKFKQLKSQGWSILTTDGEGVSEVAHEFDITVQEYFVIPQMAGGEELS